MLEMKAPQLDATSRDRLKDCLVQQQQFIFDRELRFAGEQPVHFAQLNSKLFSPGEYVLSPVRGLRSSCNPKYLASSA